MEELLQDIVAITGVSASWICDEDGTVIARQGSINIQDEQLAEVGRVLSQTIDALSLAKRRKVGDIDLVYKDGRLLAKNLSEGCLCIQGVPSLNIPLVNLTANLVVRELKKRKKERSDKAGQSPPEVDQVLSIMAGFLEALIAEYADQGIGREQLLTIAKHRLRRLEATYPFMAEVEIAEGKIELAGIPVDDASPGQIGEALSALVIGLGVSINGIVGETEALATYLGIYIPFHEKHAAAFDVLGLGDSLKEAFNAELPTSFIGVDIRLD